MAEGAAAEGASRGVSIEELFNSLSQWKAHGGAASLPRVHLSPRSAQACLREGVDPEVRPRLGFPAAPLAVRRCGCGALALPLLCVWVCHVRLV
jgi:hypothetical protein